jgi:hypothetical protein
MSSEPPKTQSFTRNATEAKVPLAWFLGLAGLAFGGGGAAGSALTGSAAKPDPAIVEAITKVDRKVDMILLRLDSYETRLVAVELEGRRNADRIMRLEAALEVRPPR